MINEHPIADEVLEFVNMALSKGDIGWLITSRHIL
jgi:hypothetical protein